ncbi:SDR family oxidoreductase [Dyadobacter psychrotolerans]|uniref:NAD-dependent epimerase/dehydratase family protein n=1 Tax=Dyadobacter psychrotolerans TaxID=2541721 RepID=A0A4R5DU34_9BACT|nr:NAD(P)H-binding protein [Dyadobacter psychrotolerans]TDE15631.1 NAD-dependent epimerase/dehydratase family protein [Dyadobacter psychrotolerans]
MKITLTGSLGHIGKPLVKELVQKGHAVTVISSNPGKQKEIETEGAVAAIGSMEDTYFLASAFSGADAVYTMVPPGNYFDLNIDLLAHYHNIGNNYAQAIKRSGVKHLVNLSTIGGNLEKGSGILRGAHDVEQILNALPSDVTITHMRPTSFYYNLYGYASMIKDLGYIAANYGDTGIPWVSPIDIAAAIADELLSVASGRKVRYVASEELTGQQTAKILGTAIGKPDLQWIVISDEETLAGLKAIGMNPKIAAGLVEMYGALQTGLLAEDYHLDKPAEMGKVKLADFALEFAEAFK